MVREIGYARFEMRVEMRLIFSKAVLEQIMKKMIELSIEISVQIFWHIWQREDPKAGETWVPSLGWEDPLEKGKATHSSILA